MDGRAWWAAIYGVAIVGHDWSNLAAAVAAAYQIEILGIVTLIFPNNLLNISPFILQMRRTEMEYVTYPVPSY